MVRRCVALCLCAIMGLAGELDDKVIHLIGFVKYNKNRAILHSIFLNSQHYRTQDGRVDTLKVVRVLKRLGFIQLRYPATQEQKIRFVTSGDPHPFMKLVFDALAKTAVFDYSIDGAMKTKEGFALTVRCRAPIAPDPVRIVATLQHAGLSVVDIQRKGTAWSYYIGGARVHLPVPQVRGAIELQGSQERYWCAVFGNVHIVSHRGNHWHPAVYVYDMRLHPLKAILLYEERKSLDISLPNGIYYITIADRFSAKNIQRGFTVSNR